VKAASSHARRSVDFLAAFATETATDNNGNTKPTALHFTAAPTKVVTDRFPPHHASNFRPRDFDGHVHLCLHR
jgi:hypothetical protein